MNKTGIRIRDYNFFSSTLGARNVSRKKYLFAAAFIGLYLAAVFCIYYYLGIKAGEIKAEIGRLDEYLASEDITAGLSAVDEKSRAVEELNLYNQAIDGIISELGMQSAIDSEYIQTITSTLPEGLYFSSISMANSQLNIRGTASTRLKITEFLNNMEALGIFEDVHISTIESTAEDTEGFAFLLSCTRKGEVSQ